MSAGKLTANVALSFIANPELVVDDLPGITYREARAEIVRRWNAHDEMLAESVERIAELKEMVAAYEKGLRTLKQLSARIDSFERATSGAERAS